MIPILPISGVPDELLRVLNERFRQLESAIAPAAATPAPAPAPARDPGTPVQGADLLLDVNRVPKIGTPGRLIESSITDDGTNVSGTEPVHLDTGATPPDSQVAVKAGGAGALALLSYAADNQNVCFDVEFSASGWKARHATVAWLIKSMGFLKLMGSAGNALGSNPPQTSLLAIDIANNWAGFGGNITPSYAVDATGYINASTGFRAGGTAGIAAVTVTLAKITAGGVNGSLTIKGGIVTGYSNPT